MLSRRGGAAVRCHHVTRNGSRPNGREQPRRVPALALQGPSRCSRPVAGQTGRPSNAPPCSVQPRTRSRTSSSSISLRLWHAPMSVSSRPSVVVEMARRAWLDRGAARRRRRDTRLAGLLHGESASAAPLGSRVHLRARHEISQGAVGTADWARRELAATGEPVGGPQAAEPTALDCCQGQRSASGFGVGEHLVAVPDALYGNWQWSTTALPDLTTPRTGEFAACLTDATGSPRAASSQERPPVRAATSAARSHFRHD
jgi:hypothetical protein